MHYPLSPAMKAFVAHSETFAASSPEIEAQRQAYDAYCRAYTPPRSAALHVEEGISDGVPWRLYRPDRSTPTDGWPALLYLHGGGWIMGGLDSHEFVTARLALDLDIAVLVPDYRLAPEAPYPAAFEDALTAWGALMAADNPWQVDPTRVAVAGDSAGGNLAAALCMALRDAGERLPVLQALIYPALSAADSASRHRYVDAPLLTPAEMQFCLDSYLPDPTLYRQPYAMPLAAKDFRGLPAAFIGVAQFDPLCDDSLAYATALRNARVPVTGDPGLGLVHGGLRALEHAVEAQHLYHNLRQALRGALWPALAMVARS